jgi:thioredoxin 1
MEIKTVIELENCVQNNKYVLVDFYATWCSPCKVLSKMLEEFQKKYPQLLIVKVNVDDAAELSEKHDISSLPTIKLFVNHHEKLTLIGSSQKNLDEIAKFIV